MPRAGRRTRCSLCDHLVTYTVEHWPRGIGRHPRAWICQTCADRMGVSGDELAEYTS